MLSLLRKPAASWQLQSQWRYSCSKNDAVQGQMNWDYFSFLLIPWKNKLTSSISCFLFYWVKHHHRADVLFLMCSQNILTFSNTLKIFITAPHPCSAHLHSYIFWICLARIIKLNIKRCIRTLCKSCLLLDFILCKHRLSKSLNSLTSISLYLNSSP